MKVCNKCGEEKNDSRFEVVRSGYVRPTCKDCYNTRRREVHGGAEREREKRMGQLEGIISTIDGCELLEVYKNPESDRCEYRIKLRYKGFDWDIRKSSFVSGLRPWRNFRHAGFRDKKCVYKFEDSNGVCLYIGKSVNISARMCKHFSNYEINTLKQRWKMKVRKVFVMPFYTCADMHIAEMFLITKLKPSHNKDAVEFDGTSFDLDLPEFHEFWVSAVYDKID